MDREDQVPRGARPFVAAFIALMIAAAVFVWEPWPFTSYRLFSQLRVDEQTAWVVRAVGDDGREQDLPLAGELRGFEFQIREFAQASPKRRDEFCRVWAGAAPEVLDEPVEEVRLYRRTWRLSDRDGDHARPGTSRLIYVCDGEGAHDAPA
jgi:hypothetical protein